MAEKQVDIDKAPPYFEASQTLDDGDSLTLAPGNLSGLNAVEVHNIAHAADCDVLVEVDTNADGTFDRSVTVDSFTGAGVSQSNELELGPEMQLKITDTSGGTDNDYILTGELLQ